MSARPRVVVTGIGAVTPIGCGAEGLWAGVLRGESAVKPITEFDVGMFRTQIAATVRDFRPEEVLTSKQARRLERFSQFAVVSARQAIDDASFTTAGVAEAIGVNVDRLAC